MDKKFNLIISAIIAISLYILFVLILLSYISSSKIKKFDSISKNTVLELDLIISKKTNNKKNSSSIEKQTNKSHKIVKRSKSISAKKTSDLKSLFARVSTKSTNIKVKKVINVQSSSVSSRFKSKYEKYKKDSNIKTSKLIDIKSKTIQKKLKILNNKGNYDKYYSKISNIILSRWYQYPLFKQNNYLVVAEIRIDNQGNFSYHIISYSGNTVVDDAIKSFLSNEVTDSYPIPPDNKMKVIKINFKPELI
jgi:protein TonB